MVNKGKMILKGLAVMLCLNFIFFSSFGCGGNDSFLTESQSDLVESVESDSVVESEELSTVSVNVAENVYGSTNKRYFRPIGRTFERNSGLACDFSCTGVRFSALCVGEIKVKFNVSAECYFTVYVNGERQDDRVAVRKGDAGSLGLLLLLTTTANMKLK